MCSLRSELSQLEETVARGSEAYQINWWGSECQAMDFWGAEDWLWDCGRIKDDCVERGDRD